MVMLDPDLIQRTLAAIHNGLVLTPEVGGAWVSRSNPTNTKDQWITDKILPNTELSYYNVYSAERGPTRPGLIYMHDDPSYIYVGFVGQDNIESAPAVSQVDGWF